MSDAYRQHVKQFSLKDELFNRKTVRKLSAELKEAYPAFNQVGFETAVLRGFKTQELMERVRGISNQLRAFLPSAYPKALKIILEALPPELDPNLSDNDFGHYIYAPYGYFVATYGCTAQHVTTSISALKEITKRFSTEGPLRDFLNSFPKETLHTVEDWSMSSNYHVRRLASEGTRPNLPWAKKITVPPKKFIPILERLHSDPTRYVVRSVANHVNDLAKIDPALAISLVKGWQKTQKLSPKELRFLVHHSLRTLIKAGEKEALTIAGYGAKAFKITKFYLHNREVKIGENLAFSAQVHSTAKKDQILLLNYRVHFLKASGGYGVKTFKGGEVVLPPGGVHVFEKSHSFALMSTRALYTGTQYIELQINGQLSKRLTFNLTD